MSTVSERIANLTPEQRALLERRMRAAAPRSQALQPIAIVGMAVVIVGALMTASKLAARPSSNASCDHRCARIPASIEPPDTLVMTSSLPSSPRMAA